MTGLARRLGDVVGARHVLVDADVRAGYEVDWTRRFRGDAALIVRPGNAGEVAEVLRCCAEAGAAVVPQGGNSGLVGGAVPRAGGVDARGGAAGTRGGSAPAGDGPAASREVVLSLTRLDAIEGVDAAAGRLVAGAGVTLAALHAAAAEHGLAFGVDFAARDLATVGGMIATNAGGARVLRHGRMAAQVAGVEAVLADGSVLRRMGAVEKDATGYDVARLLCGSEGTLAVITRARLRLVRRPARRVAALLAFASVEDAVAAVAAWRLALPGLEAAELLFENGLARVCAHRRVGRPFGEPHPVYVLVEQAGDEDPLPLLAAAIEDARGVQGTVVADDTAGRARLWMLREDVPEALGAAGVVHKLDVAVPPQRVPELAARTPEVVRRIAPAAETFLIGHLAEGNLHVNVLGLAPDDARVDAAVLELVAELGGSIAAEHGIGQAKVPWLGLSRDETDIRAMTALKRALDPDWRLNPGKLLPVPEDA